MENHFERYELVVFKEWSGKEVGLIGDDPKADIISNLLKKLKEVIDTICEDKQYVQGSRGLNWNVRDSIPNKNSVQDYLWLDVYPTGTKENAKFGYTIAINGSGHFSIKLDAIYDPTEGYKHHPEIYIKCNEDDCKENGEVTCQKHTDVKYYRYIHRKELPKYSKKLLANICIEFMSAHKEIYDKIEKKAK